MCEITKQYQAIEFQNNVTSAGSRSSVTRRAITKNMMRAYSYILERIGRAVSTIFNSSFTPSNLKYRREGGY